MNPAKRISLDFLSVALSITKRNRGYDRIIIPIERIRKATKSMELFTVCTIQVFLWNEPPTLSIPIILVNLTEMSKIVPIGLMIVLTITGCTGPGGLFGNDNEIKEPFVYDLTI